MSCSGLYRVLHELKKWLEREEKFRKRLKRVLKKYGWL
jgi:predicted transcriptional regulator